MKILKLTTLHSCFLSCDGNLECFEVRSEFKKKEKNSGCITKKKTERKKKETRIESQEIGNPLGLGNQVDLGLVKLILNTLKLS